MDIDIRQKVQDKLLVMVTCQKCKRNVAFSDKLNVIWSCPVCKTSQITMAPDFDIVYLLEPKNSEGRGCGFTISEDVLIKNILHC